MDQLGLTREIKEKAREKGFDLVGVAHLEKIESKRLNEWLARSFHGEMGYLARNRAKRLDPSLVVNNAASIVVVGLNYHRADSPPDGKAGCASLSKYAAGDDYHSVMEKRLKSLFCSIQESVPGVEGRFYVDTGPVMEKYWAQLAGIGWIGKHTNLISRRIGSWFFLGVILLDIELAYDRPALDHCGTCTACIDACPTEAIVEPYLLDARRCISYLTIELRGDIPIALRPGMGNLVFGCDICQDVCPWNSRAVETDELGFTQRSYDTSFETLAAMRPEDFRERFRGSPVKRAKWRGFMRNLAVAMGNSGDAGVVPSLTALLEVEDAMVRRHAAWALGRIGGKSSLQALRKRLLREKDPGVRRAIRAATPA